MLTPVKKNKKVKWPLHWPYSANEHKLLLKLTRGLKWIQDKSTSIKLNKLHLPNQHFLCCNIDDITEFSFYACFKSFCLVFMHFPFCPCGKIVWAGPASYLEFNWYLILLITLSLKQLLSSSYSFTTVVIAKWQINFDDNFNTPNTTDSFRSKGLWNSKVRPQGS